MFKNRSHFPLAKDLPTYEYSPHGFEDLKLKLQKLIWDRPAVVEDLAKARAMGDLSENGYYKAARMKLSSLDSQIRRLQVQVKYAKVIYKQQLDRVGFGSTVVVEVNGKQRTFTIVGNQESNPGEGTISRNSPIGKALVGRSAGETISIRVPSGTVEYRIVEIT